jgi:hypothetical protein
MTFIQNTNMSFVKNFMNASDKEDFQVIIEHKDLVACKKKICRILHFGIQINNELIVTSFLKLLKKRLDELESEDSKLVQKFTIPHR